MLAIQPPNIESELSYAYLHAVASRAGASCLPLTRHHDNSGIDAQITSWGPFPAGSYFKEVDVRVQLKATIATPSTSNGYISYFVNGVDHYNDLRAHTLAVPRILVVLFLAPDEAEWLAHTPQNLMMKRCAYWVSLRDAPATANRSGTTVYIPESQHFSPLELKALLDRLANRDVPVYVSPP
ncbi:DUF4365 domain-containing protein [uncultured Reyranella sp.]|uniref:DUF4365 domain-containing protein n=1 Tax=uncultured Reyranella sp. TaxID=735512 RepID=UPI0025F2FEFC|nr:DUF4365 domain-containing protein [uncultured Reyranella sp.]